MGRFINPNGVVAGMPPVARWAATPLGLCLIGDRFTQGSSAVGAILGLETESLWDSESGGPPTTRIAASA